MPTFAFHFPCHIRVSHFFYVFRPVYIRHILLWHVIQFMERFFMQTDLYHWYFHFSMTSLLTHTVAHSTRPSFRPKTNNQPIKKFLSLAVSWVKFVKNCKILTFKVKFLCQKWSESFYFFHRLNNIILEAHSLLLTIFENFNF